jgi:hypothetical protein
MQSAKHSESGIAFQIESTQRGFNKAMGSGHNTKVELK